MKRKAREEKVRKRQSIFPVANVHPLTVPHIMALGDFPSDEAAGTWTGKQRKKGWLKLVGTVRNELGGRPLDLYCNGWRPKLDNARHEKIGTDFALVHLDHATFVRGWDVPFRADHQMTIGMVTYSVEVDCGTMSKDKVLGRWMKYKDCNNVILVVTASNAARGIDAEERRAELMRWSGQIARLALFATIDDVTHQGPFDRFWKRVDDSTLRRITPPEGVEKHSREMPAFLTQ